LKGKVDLGITTIEFLPRKAEVFTSGISRGESAAAEPLGPHRISDALRRK